MIRVLVAEDHTIVREGIKQLIGLAKDLLVVGEAGNGEQLLETLRHVPCEVVLLDISMPGRSGIDALADIRSGSPGSRVLILSMHPEDQYAIRCLRDGADGYLTKESAPELLIDAIHKVHRGGKFVSTALAERLVLNLNVAPDQARHDCLSDRELQVLILIGSGKTATEIADALCVSVKTVSTYRTRLLEKMGMENNAQLMKYAIEQQLD